LRLPSPLPRALTFAILAVMPLMFSSNLVIGRAAIETMPPAALAFWRWLLAFLVLLPFVAPRLYRHRHALLDALPHLVMLAFLGTVICGTFVYVSLTFTTATNATLIYTTPPIFIILLERVFRGRPLSLLESTGVMAAILGVGVIVTRGDPFALAALQFNPGDLGILAAAISWAIYSVMVRTPRLAALPTAVVFTAIAGIGALLILPSWLFAVPGAVLIPPDAGAWSSVLGLALVASVLAFSAYQLGVKEIGPSMTGIFLYLLPPYGVGMSVIFLGERLSAYHLIGFVVIMAGILLATLPKTEIFKRVTAR